MDKRFFLPLLLGCFCCLMLGVSCRKDTDEGIKAKADKVYLNLGFVPADVVTVSNASAMDVEKRLYTVQALVFDKDGICFYNREIYDGYDEKMVYAPSRALGLDVREGDPYKDCTVWILSNVGKFSGADGSFDFDGLSTLSDLKAMFGYRLLQEDNQANRDCLPMAGNVEHVDMTRPTDIGSPIVVEMRRALARVNFNISVADSLEFYFNNWSVENLPRYSYVVEGTSDYADDNPDKTDPYATYYPSNDVEKNLVTSGVGQWIGNVSGSYGFYMYENRRGGRISAPDWGNLQGQSGDYAAGLRGLVDETGSNPKFKTLYAPQQASFLILTGLIRHRETQDVVSFSYKIALGSNNADDYNLERNHDYTYDIRINGSRYDDVSVDVFDSRVHKDYALQITAPESRRVDAHYEKRHIDILASAGTVEMQFYPTEDDARRGTNPMTVKDWIVLSKMDTYNIDIDPDEATSLSWTNTDVVHSRVFVYVRENLSTDMRSAVLKIVHTPESGRSQIVKDPVERYYTYSQAGVIEVDGLYVESYEEYGMNIDPYENSGPVTGMPWGWGIVKNGDAVTRAYDFSGSTNETDGRGNTSVIVGTSGEAFAGVDENSLYSNYAAKYCDNKNKRDAAGNVVERNWYLPAVDELIPLTRATLSASGWTPESMRGKEYWSSSVPSENSVVGMPDDFFWGQIIWNIFVGDYVSSGSDHEYRNVARAVSDGQEDKVTVEFTDILGWRTYKADTYPQRSTFNHVRAVRRES